MIQWLDEKDIKFLLWICPWAVGEKMETEAFKNGYAIAVPGWEYSGGKRPNFIDLTNPMAVQWWQGYLRKLLKDGVVGFKMDRGEEHTPLLYKSNQKVYDGRSGREVYNDYMRLYAKAAYDVCKEVRGDDFFIMPRAGYTGSTRYAGFWAGDTYGTPWGLRSAIIGGLRAAVIGYPVWGSDTGGYTYHEIINGKKQNSFRPKTGCRWLAFSCFSPLMEVGPTNNKGPWDIDDTFTAVWRMYAILHDNLLDYTYTCVKEAHETGMPVMRSLFLTYPDQKQAWDNWQTYLYGPDILVCAVWQDDDVVTQEVYLPAGEQWVDAWDAGKVLDGGQTINVDCPIHKIPIYIRKSSNLKLGDLNKLWTESVEAVKNKPAMTELEKKAGFLN
jgi:alpha-glucosidase (family GH31 glycosyl hydrolase)